MSRIPKVIYILGCLALAVGVVAIALWSFYEPELDIRDGSGIGNMRGDTFHGGVIYNLESDRVRRVAIRREVGVEPLHWFFRVPMTDKQFSDLVLMSGDFVAMEFTHTDSIPDLTNAPDWLPVEDGEEPLGQLSGPGGPSTHVYRDPAGYTIFRTY